MKTTKRRKKQNVNIIKEISFGLGKTKVCFSVSDIIQIFIAFFSFLSFLGVIWTLHEMQKDRNAAYKPTILMNATDYKISWNASGEEEWVSSLPNELNSSYEVNADGSITGTGSFSVSVFPENGFESFAVVNIGVGAAKDVYFEWDDNNISYLCKYLAECDPAKSNFCIYGKSATFSFDKRIVVTDIDRSVRLMYMLPEATEEYTLPLPTAYTILIHEIMKYPALPEPPHIILYAEYSDVQGKSNRDIFYVTINRTFYQNATDNSGNASYQLTPAILTK